MNTLARTAGKGFFSCLLVLGMAVSAIADASGGDDAVAEKQVAAVQAPTVKEDKVVCKRIRVTGSHFKKSICQKRSAWKQIEEESQRAMQEMSATVSGGGGGSN